MTELERDWYTTAEAAIELGITHKSIQTAIQRGRLSTVKIHPRLSAITRAELDRYRRESLGRRGNPDWTRPEQRP